MLIDSAGYVGGRLCDKLQPAYAMSLWRRIFKWVDPKWYDDDGISSLKVAAERGRAAVAETPLKAVAGPHMSYGDGKRP